MLLAGPELHCAGPLALWEFCNNVLRNISENQKKSSHVSTVSVPRGKAGPVYYITLIKD